MAASLKSLEDIRIASPCPAAWSEMKGDDQVRFCKQCRKHVYNLSALSRPEAEALVAKMEGRLCVRFYRRADGTVLTGDCPVRLRQVMHWTWGSLAAAAAFLLAFKGLGDGKAPSGLMASLRQIEPFAQVIEWLDPSPPPPPGPGWVTGY